MQKIQARVHKAVPQEEVPVEGVFELYRRVFGASEN